MVKGEKLEWLGEWSNAVVAQLSENREDIKKLNENIDDLKKDHTFCREGVLLKMADTELKNVNVLASIDKRLSSLSTMVKIYFGIYSASLLVLAEELFRHLLGK